MLLTIVTVVVISFLGLVVYYANPKQDTNQYFTLTTMCASLWIITNFLENEPARVGLNSLEMFLRLDFVCALFGFYAWLRFCESFSRKPIRFIQWPYSFPVLAILSVVIAYFLLSSDTIIANIQYTDQITFAPGPFWWVYGSYSLFLCTLGVLFLFFGRRNGIRMGQIDYVHQVNLVFWGFFISLGTALIINLMQAYVQVSVTLARIGIYGMIVLVGCTGYAIIRHHFFDVRLALMRTLTFVLISAALLFIYVYTIQSAVIHLFDAQHPSPFIFLSAFYMTAVTLLFHPVQKKVATLTNRIFFASQYEPEQLLAEMTHIMALNIDTHVMSTSLIRTLCSALQVRQAAFLIRECDQSFSVHATAEEGQEFFLSEEVRTNIQNMCTASNERDDVQMSYLFHNLPEGTVKDMFRRHSIGAVVPVRVNGVVIAILVLSDKTSGLSYNTQDADFLSVFADEVAIAISNAQSYHEIQVLTHELEGRVAERTTALEISQQGELKKAQDVANLKDEFVFLATHELRTPITAIQVFLDLVEARTSEVSPTVREYLSSISQASTQLNQLIDDLLEIARADAGITTFSCVPVNIRDVCADVHTVLAPLIAQKHLTVTYVPTVESPLMVYADREKLREVIMNIVGNAIKYNRDGGAITLSCLDGQTMVTVEVHDTGYGIPKDQQPQIFNKFFRAMAKDTEEIVGTGLGLFITKMLVEKMGGVVGFTSAEGEGTTLAFALPKPHTELNAGI
jgi:signal transduction histidine kinase